MPPCSAVSNTYSAANFHKLHANPKLTTSIRSLVLSSNEASQVILLALFAHNHRDLLERLGLERITDVKLGLRSPEGFDPQRHEPKLWNTQGANRRIVAALEETASSQSGRRIPHKSKGLDNFEHSQMTEAPAENTLDYWEERTYSFTENSERGNESGLTKLAHRLDADGSNVYLALEL